MMIASVLVCDSRGLIHVGMQWGLVIIRIAYWEADINNWKETDRLVLGLKKSDERIFSWTAMLTATYSKSHHCNKKVMIFGRICYRSPKFYTEKIWLCFLSFYFTFTELLDFRKEQSRILSSVTYFAVPCTPREVNIIACPRLRKF